MTDDILDKDKDAACSRPNLVNLLGPGTMVYAILCLGIAASINAPVTLALFFASYIIGMFNDLRQILPSKLSGWQESILVTFLGWIFFGWKLMLFSLLFVIAIQLI